MARAGAEVCPTPLSIPKSLRAPALMLFSTLSPPLLPPLPLLCSHPQLLPTPAGAGGGIFNRAGEWQPLFFSPVGDAGGDARAGGDLLGWSLAPCVKHKPLWPWRVGAGGSGLLHHAGSVVASSVSPCASRPALLRKSKLPQSWGCREFCPRGSPALGAFASGKGPLSCPFSAARRTRGGTAASPPPQPGPLGSSPAPGPSAPDIREGFPCCLNGGAALRPVIGQTGTHWSVPRAFCAYNKQRSFQFKAGTSLLPLGGSITRLCCANPPPAQGTS